MNYYKKNCKHFEQIYDDIPDIGNRVDRVKVGSKCRINKMVYRECPKDDTCFEEK